MASAGSFRLTIKPLEKGCRVTLAGALAENVSLVKAAKEEPAIVAPVTVDLAEVRIIDSIGVREWVDFLRAMPRPIVLERCSEAMVYQFGMVRETLQDARVASFFAPYECESCGRERRFEIDVPPGTTDRRALKLPEASCECGGKLVLGEHPDRYFAFLGD
jgi:hypothetical protein